MIRTSMIPQKSSLNGGNCGLVMKFRLSSSSRVKNKDTRYVWLSREMMQSRLSVNSQVYIFFLVGNARVESSSVGCAAKGLGRSLSGFCG